MLSSLKLQSVISTICCSTHHVRGGEAVKEDGDEVEEAIPNFYSPLASLALIHRRRRRNKAVLHTQNGQAMALFEMIRDNQGTPTNKVKFTCNSSIC